MTIPKLTPYTGQVANPDGSQTQTEFTQNMFDQLSYEAQLATQLDATIDGMNNAVDEVETNAVSAESSANAAEAAASSAGYQGLWPDTGGSAIKGEIWQTQVGGTPTGEYYTALQDTSVDPVGDNVNWLSQATKDYIDSKNQQQDDAITLNDVKIENLDNRVSQAENDILNLQFSVDDSDIKISSLTSRVNTNESDIAALQSGQGSGVVGYATQAELFADLNYDDGSIGYVTNDLTATNNGTYRKVGASGAGSWVQSSNDLASQAYQQSSRNTEIIDESGLSLADIPGYDFAVVDQNNKASFAVLSDGSFFDYSKLPEVRHSVIIGQSLAHGFNSSPAITTTDDLGNLTFNNDPRSTTFSLLTPLTEIDSAQEGESPASGVASQIKRGKIGQFYNDVESEFPFTSIATTHAQNAATIAQISKGTQAYDNAQEAILRAYMLSNNYDLSGIFFIQGEGDELARTDRTVYKNTLKQLKNDHITDMRSAINRPNQKVPFITYQTNDRYSFTTPIAALAQLDAANEDSDIFMATPIYFLSVSDDRHLTNHSSRWLGEMLGKVYNRIIDGDNWSPIQPLQISGAGTSEIMVKFHVPNPPLIFDEDMVVNPGDYGFEVVDDSGSVSISQVEIIDAYTVKITLSSALTANPRLRYAYTSPSGGPAGRLTGARGNLRDSDNTISNYTDAGGNPYKLYNWCVTFDEEIS